MSVLTVQRSDEHDPATPALVGGPVPAAPTPPAAPAAPRPARGLQVVAVALWIGAALLLALPVQAGGLGWLRHHRDQQVSYAELRARLAAGTGTVGQTTAEGGLVPLGTPVALLRVPRLGLQEVVLEGTTAGVLRSGPGHRRDSVLPGQAGTSVLMGRRAAYGGPFLHLAELRPGDPIEVSTGQGVARYRVTGLRHAGDPQPARLAAGQGRLTLLTGDGLWYLPDGVLRVDAVLLTPARPTPARVFSAGSLAPAERPMAGDPAAWVPLVLWAQALLLAALSFVWARARWGRWQAWVAGVPLLLALVVAVADQAARLLPNLL